MIQETFLILAEAVIVLVIRGDEAGTYLIEILVGGPLGLDGHLLMPAVGELDLDNAILDVLRRQRRDAGRNVLLGIKFVDRRDQLLKIRKIDLAAVQRRGQRLKFFPRQEFRVVELDMPEQKLRPARLKDILPPARRADNGWSLLRRALLLALDAFKLAPLNIQVRSLQNLTVQDIQRVAARLFKDASPATIVVGDAEQLKAGFVGSVEIRREKPDLKTAADPAMPAKKP